MDDALQQQPLKSLIQTGQLDPEIFGQVLEMDDGPDRDFSKTLVMDFFGQVKVTFEKMDESLISKNLQDLSTKGHFLKGSSATLGLTRLKDSCEKIQHFGEGLDATGTRPVDDPEKSLVDIAVTLMEVKSAFSLAKRSLLQFYGEPFDNDPDLAPEDISSSTSTRSAKVPSTTKITSKSTTANVA